MMMLTRLRSWKQPEAGAAAPEGVRAAVDGEEAASGEVGAEAAAQEAGQQEEEDLQIRGN